jgi:hypothetical protein
VTANEVIEQIKNRPRNIPNYRITDYSCGLDDKFHLYLYLHPDLISAICKDSDVKEAVLESISIKEKKDNPELSLFYDKETEIGGVDFRIICYFSCPSEKRIIQIIKNTQRAIDDLEEVKKRQREEQEEAQKEKEERIKKRRGVL